MKIEVLEKKDNKLLDRTEVKFRIMHEKEKTPERDLVRSELADFLKLKKEIVIVDNIKSIFGVQESIGYAKIYKSVDSAKKIEPRYMLERNKVTKGKKVESKENKEEKKGEEKPEDKKQNEKGVKEETAEEVNKNGEVQTV